MQLIKSDWYYCEMPNKAIREFHPHSVGDPDAFFNKRGALRFWLGQDWPDNANKPVWSNDVKPKTEANIDKFVYLHRAIASFGIKEIYLPGTEYAHLCARSHPFVGAFYGPSFIYHGCTVYNLDAN